MIRLATLPLFALLLLLGALVAACSSSDNSDTGDPSATATEAPGNNDPSPTVTEAPGDGDPSPTATEAPGDGGSQGSATLTVGDESWSFENVTCFLSQDESPIDGLTVLIGGSGETADGVPIRLDTKIQDIESEGRYEGDGVIHIVEAYEVEDSENPVFGWTSSVEMLAGVERVIKIDGKNVSADTTFDDSLTAGVFEDVPGTLVAACP